MSLRVDNSFAVSLAGAKLPQPTPLPSFSFPVALQVNDALVVPSEQDANWTLSSLTMLSDQTGSTLKHLGAGPLLLNFTKNNDGLELAFSSILQARELQIFGARHITIRQNAAIDANVANLMADEIHAHQGALGQGEGVFKLKAKKVILGSGRLRAGSIIAEEDLVIKRGSRLQSSQRRCDQLPVRLMGPCHGFLSSTDPSNQSWTGSIVVEEEAEIYAGSFLLCSTQNVTAEAGKSRRGTCGGGGGGHCGNGGDGIRKDSHSRCGGTGGLKYDGWWTSETSGSAKPSKVPTWSASGGGGDSAGAGARPTISIFCKALHMPSNSTSISASGEDAVARVDGGDGSGGGAGGTVIINVTNVSGSAGIEASGGKGGGCIGGGGGGGAIGSAGPNASQVWAEYSGNLVVNGGLGDASVACAPGHAGIFCAECEAGSYNPPEGPFNLTAQYRMCLPCKNKPAQGYYTATGWLNESCPYACPSGFPPMEVNPDCDDPWSYYFAFFGGVWGVALLILLTAVLFGLLISAKRVQTRRRLQWLQKQRTTGHRYVGMNDEEMLLFESLRGRHPLADVDVGVAEGTVGDFVSAVHSLRSRTVGESRPRWLMGYVSSCWRSRKKQKSGKKEAHLLHIGDLPYHTARIYLFGENVPRDPWRLSLSVPEELRQHIDDKRWTNFAGEVNQLCGKRMRFQLVAEGVLRWLYLPVAEYIRWRLRFSRAAEVAKFVWSRSEDSRIEQTIWRLGLDNSSRFGLKFGTDREMTLAYVDILDYCKALENWVVKPQLPMLIACAGDGEYTAPPETPVEVDGLMGPDRPCTITFCPNERVSAMSVSFPDVLVASIFLTLSGVAVSSTAHCKALYPLDYVCHPAIPSTCLPLDVLLSFRSRISRILLHKHLPYVVPYFNPGSFEIFADLQSWIESGALASVHHSNHHLTLALALISQGLLEAERDRRDRSHDRSVGIFEQTAGHLLAAVLTGPWVRVACSGWPIFALLGRLARLKANAPVQCAGQTSQWKEMIRISNQSGVQWPMFNLTVWHLADFHILETHLRHLDRSCLWDAADQLTIPARPVCVSIPAPGEPQPVMAARDCNPHWPHCETSIGLGHDLIPQSVFWLAKP
eukprot:symbB.v1.2.004614.t1/scaffold255.1/size249928/4